MAIRTLVIVSCDCCNAVDANTLVIFPGEMILSRFPQVTAWEQAVSIGWRPDDNGDVLCPDCFKEKTEGEWRTVTVKAKEPE